MIEAGLENAACAIISDPDAGQAGIAAGEGAAITIPLGGKFDPSVAGPIQVTGIVEALSDGNFIYEGPMFKGVKATMGLSMRLRIGGIQVVVATNRLQVFDGAFFRSEEHTSELQSLMRISYAVFCLKKKIKEE